MMAEMKQILAGVALLVLVGIAGFLYRNTMEHPHATLPGAAAACTDEAKLCPDGTGVGRTGPDCAFAPCPFPNVEAADYGIAFAVPPGYTADENAIGADPTMVGAFVKVSSTTNALQTITIRDYPVPAGTTTDAVILAHTKLQPSDTQPKSMSAYTSRTIPTNTSPALTSRTSIGANTFFEITTERFEGVVSTSYFLPRESDVLEFDIVEQDAQNWTDPKLDVDKLPAHAALLQMLSTLELTKQ
jgi:hypothetical protein